MGNATNTENWAAQERLRAVECAAWWRGWVIRRDLSEVFGISTAQASSDLQKYQELNPGALVYHMSHKRYEGAEAMRCVLHEPRLEDAMALFLQGGAVAAATSWNVAAGGGSPVVDVARVPRRVVKGEVARAVFLAVSGKLNVKVRYFSVNSGTARWREIAPRAFGHDGLRWHVRAWDFDNEKWQDFVLGRMAGAKWPTACEVEPPVDKDWEREIVLSLKINPKLTEMARAAFAMDYGVGKSGVLKVRCREAMRQYVEAMLRVPADGKSLPAHFVRV